MGPGAAGNLIGSAQVPNLMPSWGAELGEGGRRQRDCEQLVVFCEETGVIPGRCGPAGEQPVGGAWVRGDTCKALQ